MAKWKNKLSIGLIASTLLAVIIFGYGLYRSWDLISGPTIKLDSPTNGATVKNEFTVIRGRATRIANLSLNGRKIFTDEQGHFRESLLLFPGYNIISLEAWDKFGRYANQKIIIINQTS
jgi:hypothetical protein